MAAPAAVLQYIVTANTAPADAALARSQMRLKATAASATATGSAMRKGLGIGAVAAGALGLGAFKMGAEFDNAFDKIQVGTGASGKEFKRLQGDFRRVFASMPTDMDTVAKAVTGLNQRLDLTGKPLRDLSRQLIGLSKITETDIGENVRSVTRLFGDWSVETKNQSKTLDGLFRISQKTGIQVSELADTMVQFGSPMRTLGLDFDFAASMIAQFEKEGVNMTTLMSGLRLSVANLSDPTDELAQKFKEFGITAKEPAEQVFQVMEAIKRTASVTKGNTLAFEVFGRRAGSDMAAAIREGRFEVEDLMETMDKGRGTIKRTERSTRDAEEWFTILGNTLKEKLEPAFDAFYKGIGKVAKALTKLLRGELDQFSREMGKVLGLVDTLDQRTVIETVQKGGLGVEQALEALKEVGVSTKKARKIINETYGFTETRTEKFAAKLDAEWSHLSPRITDNTDEIRRKGLNDFKKLGDGTEKRATEMSRNVTKSVFNMVGAVGSGYNRLKDNTNKALKAFNAKPVNFVISDGKKVGTSGLQRGGPIGGMGTGDKVPAMLEPGEFVVNRKATAAARPFLERINSGIPRFATGGMVGLQPGISRLASWAADRYGLRISSGYRPGDSGSLHSQGAAVDLIPPGMAATQGIFGAFKNQLAELFYDPWGGWDSGQHIGAIGGHMDHIHAAILGAGGPAAMMKKLKRLILKGPKGPLRDMGQRGLDKVRSAGNKYLSRHAMTSHGNLGNISGPLQSIAQRMIAQQWGMGQWPFFNDLVMRESGWDPTAVNPSSGAAGLAQALPPSKYPAGAWPYRGKSSAVKQLQWMVQYIQGRYGNPAGAIAWHNAHNWYGNGGDFIARKPQLIGVGDGGAERVQVTPLNKRGSGKIEVHLHGPGMDAMVDEMYAVMDGQYVEIMREGGKGLSRSKQLPGRAGRG
jgi:TP901 family phage tail tape measure protein